MYNRFSKKAPLKSKPFILNDLETEFFDELEKDEEIEDEVKPVKKFLKVNHFEQHNFYISTLFNNTKKSDIKFTFNDSSSVIYSHKSILCARS